MKISISKKRIVISIIVLLCMGQILWIYPSFIKNRNNLFFLFVVFIISAIFLFIKFEFNKTVKKILSIGMLLVLPFVLFQNMQNPLGSIANIKAGGIWLNIGLLVVMELILFLISNRTRIVGIVSTISMIGLSFANMFVFYFRGRPLELSDVNSIKTAVGVSSNYSLWINDFVVKDILYLFLLVIIFMQLDFRIKKLNKRLLVSGISIILIFVSFLTVYRVDWLKEKSFEVNQILSMNGVKENGYFLDFYLNSQELKLLKPEGYNEEIIEEVCKKQSENIIVKESLNMPNIIIIMNESFCDMDSLGDVVYSENPLPFFNSLEENTVRGNLISSVFGGNTPNSEFECLTGGSLAFFPKDTIVYQQFLHSKIPSTVSQLSKLGYEAIAIHPNNSLFWERNRVYPEVFGFDEFISHDFIQNPILVRDYISDEAVFDILLERMKSDEEDNRIFNFTITMQNHGGYYFGMTDVVAPEINNPYVNEYLSLMKITDEAFKDFLTSLENFEEPTIVCMFGDHQPRYEDSVYEKIWENSDLSEEEKEMLKHVVPFVIWANYDIEEKEVPLTSINFLSPMIFEAAGMKQSPYYNYLLDLQEKYPSISALGCYDKDGEFYARGDEMNSLEDIQIYNIIQYNYFHDEEHRNMEFFGEKE